MAFYASRRKTRPKEKDETGGELNIIPYLDIMMNLIMFMLLSITGFAVLGMLDVTAPPIGGPVANNDPGTADKKNPLTLSVNISTKGFFIAATGAVLPGLGNDPNTPTIPRLPPGVGSSKSGPAGGGASAEGEYDYAALTAKMKEIKASFPNETRLIIAADAATEYSVLVHTMDATRETKDHEKLFYDVSLAQF
jgi:biopolymer transport protein ExbD